MKKKWIPLALAIAMIVSVHPIIHGLRRWRRLRRWHEEMETARGLKRHLLTRAARNDFPGIEPPRRRHGGAPKNKVWRKGICNF